MEKWISKGVGEISPFVYCEVFKKFQKQLKDYAVIKVYKDPDEINNVLFRQLEPDDGGRVYNLRSNTFEQDSILLVMVQLGEGTVLLATYDEVAESVSTRAIFC